MKYLFVSIVIASTTLTTRADYSYLKLSELVCHADFAATGTIVELDRSYFYLQVDQYVLGELDLDTLIIQRFENWPCGKRYKPYELGQRELVFFQKSNYIIENYDLLGYGAGGEFELPIRGDSIYYSISYGKLESFSLSQFLNALSEFDDIKRSEEVASAPFSNEERIIFSQKSELHKLFIECERRSASKDISVPTKGYLANLEYNRIYQDYDNVIHVFGFDIDTIVMLVKDAEVVKQDDYFIVNPRDAWTRRWLKVYSVNDTDRTQSLYSQIFDVIELPEPRIYFGSVYSDTIYSGYDAIPSVAHYLDHMHKDKHLDYELLSYTYTIKADGKTEVFNLKNSRGTTELRERLRNLNPGDEVILSDVFVLYPNNTVKEISGRKVIFEVWG